MQVTLLPEARREFRALVAAEREAMRAAMRKLELHEAQLGFPHSSAVQGATKLRELRPRGGHSSWRAFYRRVGDEWVLAAIGPEAQADPQGFRRAVRLAEQRLALVSPAPREEH